MFSKSDEKSKVEFISRIFSSEGFDVKKDYKIAERFYADIVAIRGGKAVLVEVKPSGFKLDQSDLMQVSGYVGALKEKREFQGKDISGCIVSSGTIAVATPLTIDLGIHVIASDKEEEIKKGIMECILGEIRK